MQRVALLCHKCRLHWVQFHLAPQGGSRGRRRRDNATGGGRESETRPAWLQQHNVTASCTAQLFTAAQQESEGPEKEWVVQNRHKMQPGEGGAVVSSDTSQQEGNGFGPRGLSRVEFCMFSLCLTCTLVCLRMRVWMIVCLSVRLCHKLVSWVRTAGIGSSCAIKRVFTGDVWMEGQANTINKDEEQVSTTRGSF